MLTFFVISMVGLALLLFSAIFGHDQDFAGHEFSFEHGYESGDTGGGPSIFNFKVIALFMVAFGAGGAIARYYDASYLVSSLIGVGSGLVIGGAGWQLMRLLWRQQGSSTLYNEDLVNCVGQVKTAIPGSGVGEISVVVKNQRQHLPARSEDGMAIEEGAEIKITSCPGEDTVIVQRVKN
jgi:hypothetical protein